jgi:hypothetical protein
VADERRPLATCSKHRLEQETHQVTKTIEKAKEALVLEAFDTLFNQRDYKAAGGFGR